MINKIIKSQICLMFVYLMFLNSCFANYTLEINKEIDKSLFLYDAVNNGRAVTFSPKKPEEMNNDKNWELTTHIISHNRISYTVEILHFYPESDYLFFKSFLESSYVVVAKYYNHFFKKVDKYHPLQIILSITPKAIVNTSGIVKGKQAIIKNFNSRYGAVDNLLFVNSALMTPLNPVDVILHDKHYFYEPENKSMFLSKYIYSTFKRNEHNDFIPLFNIFKNLTKPFNELKNEFYNQEYPDFKNNLIINLHKLVPLTQTYYDLLNLKIKKKKLEDSLNNNVKIAIRGKVNTKFKVGKKKKELSEEEKNALQEDKEKKAQAEEERKNNLREKIENIEKEMEEKKNILNDESKEYLSSIENELVDKIEKYFNEIFDEFESKDSSFNILALNEIFLMDVFGTFTKIDKDYVNPIFSSFLYEIAVLVIENNNIQSFNTEGIITNLSKFIKENVFSKKHVENYFDNCFEEIFNKMKNFVLDEIAELKKTVQDDSHMREYAQHLNLFVSKTKKFYRNKFSLIIDNTLNGFWEPFFEEYRKNCNYFIQVYNLAMKEPDTIGNSIKNMYNSIVGNEVKKSKLIIDTNIFLQIGGWTNGPRSMIGQRTFIPFEFFDMYKGTNILTNVFKSNEVYVDPKTKKAEYLTPTSEDISKVGFRSNNIYDIQAILQKFASFQEYNKEINYVDLFLRNVRIQSRNENNRMIII